MRKAKKLAVYSVLLLLLTAWLYWGNETIGTTRYEVRHPKIRAALSGFTIVQVSDLHNKEFRKQQESLIDKIAAENPDMIAVTGDLIDVNRTDVMIAMDFIKEAVKIAPVYYVTGNHESVSREYEHLLEQLAQAGVKLMDGEASGVTYNGESIRILGVRDPGFNVYRSDDKQVNDALEQLVYDDTDYTILLSHRPELFDVYVDNKINLVLTGHAHGGQVRLPFVGGLISPGEGFFPTYTEGTFKEGGTEMVVSRGLGSSSIKLRVNNRPEIVVVTLFAEE